jgi:hypothetical protein
MFPDFAERTVKISHRNKIFVVPKLSILQYSQALKIINAAERQGLAEESRCKLWELLEGVLPEKISHDRDMFDYNDLVELCMFLAFGSYLDNRINEQSEKYYEPPNLPDYQFKAMRILSQLGGYTLEGLLNEPASIFFALSDYVDRVTADKAIELIAAGINGTVNNLNQLKAKRGSLTVSNPNCTQMDISHEQQQEMEEFLKDYQASREQYTVETLSSKDLCL